MVGIWRTIYYYAGWDYPEQPSEKTLRCREELMTQIKKSKLKLKPLKIRQEIIQQSPFNRKKKKNKKRRKNEKAETPSDLWEDKK